MKGADSVGRWRRLLPVVAVALAAGVLTTSRLVEAQRSGAGKSVNWPLHNLDVFGGRFSTLDQITRSNVKTLTPRWLFQYGIIDGVSNLILSLGLPKP